MHNALDIFLIYVYMKTDTYIIFCQFFIGVRKLSQLIKRQIPEIARELSPPVHIFDFRRECTQ